MHLKTFSFSADVLRYGELLVNQQLRDSMPFFSMTLHIPLDKPEECEEFENLEFIKLSVLIKTRLDSLLYFLRQSFLKAVWSTRKICLNKNLVLIIYQLEKMNPKH